MRIKETIERECCNQYKSDLEVYNGKDPKLKSKGYFFCKHCGQMWKSDSRMDAAGGKEDFFEAVNS